MKLNLTHFLLLLSITLISCNNNVEETENQTSNVLDNLLGIHYKGTVLKKDTTNFATLIYFDLNEDRSNYELVISIQDTINDEIFIDGECRLLRRETSFIINNQGSNYHWTTNNDLLTEICEDYRDDDIIGFSFQTGNWDLDDQKSIDARLKSYSGIFSKTKAGISCRSGGEGAISCSIGSGGVGISFGGYGVTTGTDGCSVSCSSNGFFACCNPYNSYYKCECIPYSSVRDGKCYYFPDGRGYWFYCESIFRCEAEGGKSWQAAGSQAVINLD